LSASLGFRFENARPGSPEAGEPDRPAGFLSAEPLTPDRIGPGCRPETPSEPTSRALCPQAGLTRVVVRGPERRASLVLNAGESGARPDPSIRTRVEAGRGHDEIFAESGFPTEISCGLGLDEVTADSADLVESDCETVRGGPRRGPPLLPALPSRTRLVYARGVWGFPIRVTCPATGPDDSCGGWIDLIDDGPPKRPFGAVQFQLRRGTSTTVTVVARQHQDRVRRRVPGSRDDAFDAMPRMKRVLKRGRRPRVRAFVISGDRTVERVLTVTGCSPRVGC
jgi:hypothetical protein